MVDNDVAVQEANMRTKLSALGQTSELAQTQLMLVRNMQNQSGVLRDKRFASITNELQLNINTLQDPEARRQGLLMLSKLENDYSAKKLNEARLQDLRQKQQQDMALTQAGIPTAETSDRYKKFTEAQVAGQKQSQTCLLYTSPSPRDS